MLYFVNEVHFGLSVFGAQLSKVVEMALSLGG